MKRQIGVDFGTSTTVVVYRDHDAKNPGDIKPVKFDGVDFVPTLILEEGSILNKKGTPVHHEEVFGREAEQAHKFHSLLKANFKMNLISSDPALRKEAQELAKKFFAYLYAQYSAKAVEKKDAPIDQVSTIVTYPAKFPKEAQQVLKEAAEKAGFQNVRLADESKAAMAYSLVYETGKIKQYVESRGHNKLKVLLIDMGAGTTDIAVFEYDTDDATAFNHICSWPENGAHNFGGREIDDKLCAFYKAKLGEEAIVEELFKNDPVVADKLLAKQVKDFKDGELSRALAKQQTVTRLPGDLENIVDELDEEPDTDLNRSSFEALLKDYLPQFPELVKGALKKANLPASDIDLVLLTGGHSQWYFVKDKLTGLGIAKDAIFGFSDPHLVVAQGAAWYTEPKKPAAPPVNPDPEKHDRQGTKEKKQSSSNPPTPPAGSDQANFVMVTWNTPMGSEPAVLSLAKDNADVPVTLRLLNRPFSRQFLPDAVQRVSGTKLVLTESTKKHSVTFPNNASAELWYGKLKAHFPVGNGSSKNTTAPKSKVFAWDIDSDVKEFTFGYVTEHDDQCAHIVFNKPLTHNNRLLFYGSDHFRLTDQYATVEAEGSEITVYHPKFSDCDRKLVTGNVVLATAFGGPHPMKHWNFKGTRDGNRIKIELYLINPAIILKRPKASMSSARSFYAKIDGTLYVVKNGTEQRVNLTKGTHHIEAGNMNLLGSKSVDTNFGIHDLDFDYGETLVFDFGDDPHRWILQERMKNTSGPKLLKQKT